MFVFPAFNNSYKTRKRTFRCCKTCRVKRIRCTILDASYEEEGCDNCKNSGAKCDFIKASNSKVQFIQETQNSQNPRSESALGSNSGYEPRPTSTPDSYNTTSFISRDKTSNQNSVHKLESLPKSTTASFTSGDSVNPENRWLNSFSSSNNFLLPLNATVFDLPRPDRYQGDSSNFRSVSGLNILSHGFLKSSQNTRSVDNLYPLPGLSSIIPRTFSSVFLNHSPISPVVQTNFAPKDIQGSGNDPLVDTGACQQTSQDFNRISIAGITSENVDQTKNKESSSDVFGGSLHQALSPKMNEITEAYLTLSNSIDEAIERVDHRYLKRKFNFNCTFRQSQFYFTKAGVQHHGKTEDETVESRLSKRLLNRSKYLDRSNLLHFKFLLSLHAFTLDTPGFCHIDSEDLVKLFDIYFYKVNSVFPIVFEAEFWELYKRGRIPNIIMYAIILNAANDELSEPILARSFVESHNSYEANCARFVKELEMKIRQLLEFLPELGDTEKLSRLITLLLLSINFRYNKIGNEQSSSDVGDSISYAYSLLIHNDYFHAMILKVGASKKSVYLKNLWWVIFIFDRFNALLNGKAMFIKRVDFNISRPSELPHLDRLVILAYALEDTLVAAFRPQRNADANGSRIISEHIEGDPCFDPVRIINDEISLLENTEYIEKVLSIPESIDEALENHLPNIDVEVFRDRFVFFIERLLRHQIILVLRTGQFKVLREASQIDTLGLKLSKSLLKIFQQLKGGQSHKLVMATPLVPLMLLVALSVPSFARYSLLHSKGYTADMKQQLIQLIEDYMSELGKFSKKLWFLHEVLNSLSKKHLAESKKSMESISPDSEYITPKHHTISINTLVSDATDAECVLPSLLSITSPGFYEDAEVKEDSEGEDEEPAEIKSGKKQRPGSNLKEIHSGADLLSTLRTDSESRGKVLPDFGRLHTDFNGLCGESDEGISLTDDLNFDVTQLAEMVSVDANFMPHVMDYFPDSDHNIFF